jgi:hypothetical protein
MRQTKLVFELTNLFRGLQSIHTRHDDVSQYHIKLSTTSHCHCWSTTCCRRRDAAMLHQMTYAIHCLLTVRGCYALKSSQHFTHNLHIDGRIIHH